MVVERRQAAQQKYTARVVWFLVGSLPGLPLALPASAATAAKIDPIPLSEGVTSIATQGADEPVAYVFEALSGQTYLIEVEQQGLDFRIIVETPAGGVTTFNSPTIRDEKEFVVLESAAAGRYLVTVVSREPTNARGTYVLSISSSGSGGEGSRRLKALRLMSDAAAANADDMRWQEALSLYERAAELWRELGDSRLQAQSLYSAARLRYRLHDWDDAAALAKAVAELYGRLNVRSLQATALSLHGRALVEISQLSGDEPQASSILDQALSALQASYTLHKTLGNSYDVGAVANNIGLAYYNRGNSESGDYRLAEAYYHEADQLFSSLGEWRDALNARHNMALINLDEGYAAAAARKLESILAEIPEGKDARFRGAVLANLGFAHVYEGDFDAALEALTDALGVFRGLEGVENWEGFALRGLGSTYYALGELERAREYLGLALEKSSDDGRVRASVLANLGNVAYRTGDYAEALDLHERAVQNTISGADRAYRHTFVARDLVALGRFDDAVTTAKAALSGTDIPAVTEADLSVELGYAFLGLADIPKAAAHFDRALAVYDSLGLEAEQAKSLNGRALTARAQGDLAGAIRLGEQSLQRIERLRASVSAPDLRALYTAGQREYYETQIDLLMAATKEEPGSLASDSRSAALSVTERARARMTVELLAEASVDLNRDVPPAIFDRQRELYEELNALRYQRDRMLANTASTAAELSELVRRTAEVQNDISLLETETRRNNSRRAEPAVPQPLTAQNIQALLDARSVLVQYALGKEKSYVWVVTNDSIQSVELADRTTIESAARRAYESLKTNRLGTSDAPVSDTLAMLSELVLVPVAPLLQSKEHLIVAADGALHYIPFGVLPIARDGGSVPLLHAVEVSNVPSMSVVAAQRAYSQPRKPTKTLAVFADPVFTETDSRFDQPGLVVADAATAVDSPITRSSLDTRLARLPATGAEARAIADLVPQNARLVATGFDASRDAVLTTNLSEYQIIHFATHGLVDSSYPGLSALALSQFDAAGLPQNGLLRLQDVYALDLNADLVVLSGCETALGRDIRGEGLIGLVQGFLYAGARNLVVSLWQVPDRATAELMTRFYGYVLHDGLRPAAALRQAQLSIARERRWSNPYFWSAFIVLKGE